MRRRDIMSTYCTSSSSDRFEFLYEYYHNYKNILSCERHCVIYMIQIVEDYHNLKEEQQKRLMAYMEALKKIESLEEM